MQEIIRRIEKKIYNSDVLNILKGYVFSLLSIFMK